MANNRKGDRIHRCGPLLCLCLERDCVRSNHCRASAFPDHALGVEIDEYVTISVHGAALPGLQDNGCDGRMNHGGSGDDVAGREFLKRIDIRLRHAALRLDKDRTAPVLACAEAARASGSGSSRGRSIRPRAVSRKFVISIPASRKAEPLPYLRSYWASK